MQKNTQWQCRIAPSLGGGFAGTPESAWNTKEYTDNTAPTCFFGCYGLPDFMTIRQHKGRKAILWAGSDIRHLQGGYWLDDEGKVRLEKKAICKYLNEYCENWVENEVEYKALKRLGIEAKVCPSFLGDVNDYKTSFKPGNKVYTSVSGDDFELYGWYHILPLARENPDIDFHLYGNTKNPFWAMKWLRDLGKGKDKKSDDWWQPPNVILHGRVSQEQMNEEIEEMQGALRLVEFEGFSEIVAKSLLWGQYPISLIDYPNVLKLSQLNDILSKKEPNLKGREWVFKSINNYPWNKVAPNN